LADHALHNDCRRSLRVYERGLTLLAGGKTGTGTEDLAKALHQVSSRSNKPFVALNCVVIPKSLIESELFGYRGGSFNGSRKEGMRSKHYSPITGRAMYCALWWHCDRTESSAWISYLQSFVT
jgi:transcriptional regulator of acetoin/glycerol metabolism